MRARITRGENGLQLRQLRLRDYDGVAALWRGTPGIGLDDECDSRRGIARYLRRNPGLSFVAIARGRVVGAVLCGHDGRRGYLHHLTVTPAWRGRGAGAALVAACLTALGHHGIPKCNIFLFRANRRGRVFWRHVGWKLRKDLQVMQRVTRTPMAKRPPRGAAGDNPRPAAGVRAGVSGRRRPDSD